MKLFITIISVFLVGCQSANTHRAPNNAHLLILNKSTHSAWFIDAQNGNIAAKLPSGVAPHEVAVSPDKSRAIITNYGDQHGGNSLTIVDLERMEVSKTISLEEFARPHGVEWFADNKTAIVTAEAQQAALIVNIDTGQIQSHIKTNQEVSHMVALGPQEHTAFITNLGSGSVSILDLVNGQVDTTIKTGKGTEGVAIVPKQNEVWITNRSANSVSILDIESQNITHELESADFPIRAELSNNQQWMAISNAQSSEVTIFDVTTHKQLHKFSTNESSDGMPIGLTFSDDDQYLYIANSNQNNIAVVSTQTWELTDTFSTDKTPDGIAFISNKE